MEGEGYTAHENGLEECLPCRQCKDGTKHNFGETLTLFPFFFYVESLVLQGFFALPVIGSIELQEINCLCGLSIIFTQL